MFRGRDTQRVLKDNCLRPWWLVHSKLLFAAPVWTQNAVGVALSRSALAQAQRYAVTLSRIARCYRTVSDVVAFCYNRAQYAPGLPTSGGTEEDWLLSQTRWRYLLQCRREEEALGAANTCWQEQRQVTTKGGWTRRLIDAGPMHLGSQQRDVSFHLAQVFNAGTVAFAATSTAGFLNRC